MNDLRLLVEAQNPREVKCCWAAAAAYFLWLGAGRWTACHHSVGSLENARVLPLPRPRPACRVMQAFELWVDVVCQQLYFLIPCTEKFNSLKLVAMHLLRRGPVDLVGGKVLLRQDVVGLGLSFAIVVVCVQGGQRILMGASVGIVVLIFFQMTWYVEQVGFRSRLVLLVLAIEYRCATLVLLVLLRLPLDFFHRHAHHLDGVLDHVDELVRVDAIDVGLLLRGLLLARGILLLIAGYWIVRLVIVLIMWVREASADPRHCLAEWLWSHWVVKTILIVALWPLLVRVLAEFLIGMLLGLRLRLRLEATWFGVLVAWCSLRLGAFRPLRIRRRSATSRLLLRQWRLVLWLVSWDDASFKQETLGLIDSSRSIVGNIAGLGSINVKVKSVSPSVGRSLHLVNCCLVLLVQHVIHSNLEAVVLHDSGWGRS